MSFAESLETLVERDTSGLLAEHPTWCRVNLAGVASVLNGFPFPSSRFGKGTGKPLLRIRDIMGNSTEASYDGDYEETYLVRPNELVVGMDGDFNCALWRGPEALLNQRVCKVTPDERFYSRKLLAFALPGYLSAINAATSSVTVKHLSSNTVMDIPFPLPPLGEQERMVEEIERQFSRLDAGVTALQKVKAGLKWYRASVLHAACEGRLVPAEADLARKEGRDYEPASQLLRRILAERRAKWEADQLAKMQSQGKPPKDDKWKAKYQEPTPPDTGDLPAVPEGWCWARTEQLYWDAGYGTSVRCDHQSSGIPVIRIPNLISGRVELSDLKYATAGIKIAKGDMLSPSDLLVILKLIGYSGRYFNRASRTTDDVT